MKMWNRSISPYRAYIAGWFHTESGDYTRINPAMDEHGEINILIFNGLTSHDGDNQVVPGLAKSWDFDEDTWHLYLPPGRRCKVA